MALLSELNAGCRDQASEGLEMVCYPRATLYTAFECRPQRAQPPLLCAQCAAKCDPHRRASAVVTAQHLVLSSVCALA